MVSMKLITREPIHKRNLSLKEVLEDPEYKGYVGWTKLPDKRDLDHIKDISQKYKDKGIKNFVVCGIGGSALSAKAVHTAINGIYHNEFSRDKCKIYIEDNLDPDRMSGLFKSIIFKDTVFNIVTKSGTTMESLVQLMFIYERLVREDLDPKNHIIITLGSRGDLYDFALERDIRTLWIPEDIGGRFSAFTSACLLPLAMIDVDIYSYMDGAGHALYSYTKTSNLDAVEFARTMCEAYHSGYVDLVFMPYSSSLKYIADWFSQLWAESLGKSRVGQMPVPALGTTDQHSLLQLLIDGPKNKMVTILKVASSNSSYNKSNMTNKNIFKMYSGIEIDDLRLAALDGTVQSLAEVGVPVMLLELPEVTSFEIGWLLMFFMLATAYSGYLYDINPYDQPGVSRGKEITTQIIKSKER